MQLEGVVNYEAFRQGITGFNRIDSRNKDILALVDFSKPSTEERLFIFDLANREVLFITHVSHGRNSGGNYANSFSNVNGSYQSSLGFYRTEHTYQGKNGYSLVLEGLEAGINDLAKERAIVMHGAAYSNPSVIASGGRLGRSLGCPSVPEALARPVIDTLKEGAILFIFADQPNYRNQSSFLS
ncbi:MAG: murein L,D-transpeptidase catalytic domain family protein [Tannerellaceae bacterium]|nr:murein L,D-transpeptidase catalytic domain family protein [Tannerellaceae bacterium]